ncbi:unnamed protein product [Larinioides sclopetarius]|uniref:Uncharacterized protein n=1 Tax=Larinioides sclopetarius TaxID=280406 RepID=A0AAV1YXN5_9ARAC
MLSPPKKHVSEMNLASEKQKKGKKDETMTFPPVNLMNHLVGGTS